MSASNTYERKLNTQMDASIRSGENKPTGSNPVLTTDNNNSGVRVLLALKGVCFQRFESESGGGNGRR